MGQNIRGTLAFIMAAALFGFSLLTFSVVSHWVLWRIRLPRRQTRALLVWLLGIAPILFVAAAWLMVPATAWPQSAADIFRIALFQISMSLAYIVTYSALEEQSPTLALVRFVADAGASGRTRDDLRRIVNDETVVKARIAAGVRDGLMSADDAGLELTKKGRHIARTFGLYRTVLGTSKGR